MNNAASFFISPPSFTPVEGVGALQQRVPRPALPLPIVLLGTN